MQDYATLTDKTRTQKSAVNIYHWYIRSSAQWILQKQAAAVEFRVLKNGPAKTPAFSTAFVLLTQSRKTDGIGDNLDLDLQFSGYGESTSVLSSSEY